MLPRTTLQQLIPQRLTELRKRLYRSIWHRVDEPVRIEMTAPRQDFVNYAQARRAGLAQITTFPHVWGPKWAQAWFRLKISSKRLKEGLYLYWDDEGEATLYADGLPWYGIDSGHHRAPLPTSARELWIESTCSRTGVWVGDGRYLSDEGSVLKEASLWRRDENAWVVYWDFCVLLDVLEYEYKHFLTQQDDWNAGNGFHQPVFRISPLFRRLMRGLDAFADRFDHDGHKAAPMLKKIYRDLPASSASLRGILTGHAHIDLVWLWPERVGESKAVHSFATANRLMETYPEFRFGYSQPASYDAVEQRSPELMKAVREKIQKGQWEATGGSDVESDTQLPCGEALARAFLIGQERFEEIRGEPSRTLWLPDVFGYSPCLPQILRQTGIDWFFTTKLTWGTINRFPYSCFRWAGHDGSEVLVHVSQEVGYNGCVDIPNLKKMEECHQEAGIHNEFLVPTGYGDGGGGPSPEMIERAKRVKDLCGLPKCEWGLIEDFFTGLEKVRPELPEWRGELYLEYHRGVQTTHGDLKAAFRGAERALQAWEAAHALLGRGPVEVASWRRVIFCQFHDAIPGSSIREVYEEMVPELESITHHALEAAQASFGKGPATHLFNPTALPVTVPAGDRLLDLAPLAAVPLSEARASMDAVRVTEKSLQNNRVKTSFNRAGEITSLTIDGHRLDLASPGNQIWVYPDHPHMYEAWDIDRGTLGNGKRVRASAVAQIEEAHSLRSVLAFSRRITEKSNMCVRYILEAESPVLRIEWEFDWQDPEMLVKSVFETGYSGVMARFGAPFGSVLRSQHPGDPRMEAMFEVPGSRWGMVSDDGEDEGLALVSEAKYGFSVRNGSIGMSLLKSARIKDADQHLSIRDLKNESPFSDLGKHHIRGAVSRVHTALERGEQPAALAERLYQEPLRVASSGEAPLFRGLEGGSSLVPVWVKPESDGAMVVRLNETMGRRGACGILLAEGATAEVVDLSGNPMEGVSLKQNRLKFGPYALIGLYIRKA